jgi:hypothetical protein
MKLFVVKKMPVLGTALISVMLLSLSHIAIAASNASERWFEVELIVFSPAGNTALKEQFDSNVKPIRLSNSFDLLTAKYQPAITPLLQALSPCNARPNTIHRYLPAALRNWQQWQPPYAPLFCISEAEPASWQRSALFPEQLLNTELPMPERLPVILAAESEQHKSVPYLAPSSAFALTELAGKINRQPNQSVLLHTVWRQAPVTEKQAVPSRWFAGKNYSSLVDYWGQDINKTAIDDAAAAAVTQFNNTQQDDLFNAIDTLLNQLQAAGQLESMAGQDKQLPLVSNSLSNLPNHIWQLDGLFKLHLDHYLFINTEFNLRRIAPEGNMQNINVQQSRRVISGELHYLDHPYLGMVVQIRRFEPPKPQPAAESSTIEVNSLLPNAMAAKP